MDEAHELSIKKERRTEGKGEEGNNGTKNIVII
jgi:hypothetical protein